MTKKKIETKETDNAANLGIGVVNSRFLTVEQVRNACKKHKYLLLRFASGNQMGINTKVSDLALKRKTYHPKQETDFISYKPCGLNEYIEHKHVFLNGC